MAPTSDDEEEKFHQAKLRYRGTRPRDVDFLVKSSARDDVVQRPSGLQYKVRRKAPTEAKKPGKSTPCRIHYRGILTDGTEFESTYRGGQPMLLKPEQVSNVPGFYEALMLMREGDRWEIIVPSELGYGERGAGPIPGGAVLVYEVDLLEVDAKEPADQSMNYMIIAAIILFGMGLVAYLHFSRPPPAPRGPPLLPEDCFHKSNPYVFFDLEVAGKRLGRVEFELFEQVMPRTAENFRALSTGEKGIGESGKPLHFKGSSFHRIIPGFMCQGGDFTHGDGRGGESIYGRMFEDEWEHGVIHHSQGGLLSMANRGPNTQSSQFFVTFAPAQWLDGKHAVFGRVVRGMDLIKAVEALGSHSGRPSQSVLIADSGQLTGPYGDVKTHAPASEA